MNYSLCRSRPFIVFYVLTLLAGAWLWATVAIASGTHTGGHADEFTFGKPGQLSQVSRTVNVMATEMAFKPSRIQVKDGETVRFVVHNQGQLLHEFNIGTPALHEEHQEEMQEMMAHGMLTSTGMPHPTTGRHPGSHGHHDDRPRVHDDPNSILLEPGETKELIWTFDKAQSLQFACNVPDHYEAGMQGRIEIE